MAEFGVLSNIKKAKFTKSEFSQIPFSAFRFPLSVTAVILRAKADRRIPCLLKQVKKSNLRKSKFKDSTY